MAADPCWMREGGLDVLATGEVVAVIITWHIWALINAA